MRYPQCTSPTSNALYIGILALSSEVSEDTTDCLTLEKVIEDEDSDRIIIDAIQKFCNILIVRLLSIILFRVFY